MGGPVGGRAGVRETGRAEGGCGGVDARMRDEVPATRRRGFSVERESLSLIGIACVVVVVVVV